MPATALQPTVLIVEDHPDTANLLLQYLTRKGIPAEVVSTGHGAFALIDQGVPLTCMIVDDSLPGMDGRILLRKLKSRPEYRNLPVVFYSASYDWRKQLEAESRGADPWFVKGAISLAGLFSKIQSYDHP